MADERQVKEWQRVAGLLGLDDDISQDILNFYKKTQTNIDFYRVN